MYVVPRQFHQTKRKFSYVPELYKYKNMLANKVPIEQHFRKEIVDR